MKYETGSVPRYGDCCFTGIYYRSLLHRSLVASSTCDASKEEYPMYNSGRSSTQYFVVMYSCLDNIVTNYKV
jgi:hypothetical protein